MLINCEFYSKTLRTNTNVNVIIPEQDCTKNKYYDSDIEYPVLYLFHGVMGNYSDWVRYTRIENYVQEYNLAVVMPSAQNSFYNNIPNGMRYWTYISEELPEVMRGLFHFSEKRENNFVAGLSMGGYGALKLALRKPESFCAVASLSGAVDVVEMIKQGGEIAGTDFLKEAFCDLTKVEGSENDLKYIIKKLKNSGNDIPKIFQCCGTEDTLYPINIEFRDYVKDLGIDITYEEGQGAHTWDFWDEYIQKVLEWLPIKK